MSSIGLREFHPFEAAGRRFLYLVPSAAVFALDDCSAAILDSLANGPRPVDDLTRELSARFDAAEVGDTIAELQRVRALGESSAKPAAAAEDHSAEAGAAADAGRQRHQPVQPGLHLLLRVRRRQDRRHRERQAAEVHERGDGARGGRVRAARIARQPARAHHVLRRRNADELQRAQGDDRLRAPARRRSRQGHRLQPDDQRDAAAAGRDRVPRRRARRRDDFDRRPGGDAGQVPRLQQRHRQLRGGRAEDQGAAGAASLAADRRARHADEARRSTSARSIATSPRSSASGKSGSRR